MKLNDLVFILAVFALLIVPGAMTAWTISKSGEQTRSDSERRNLATLSGTLDQVQAGDLTAAEIGPAFGDAFKDQLAWRTAVTQFVNGILVNRFARSTNESVVVAPGGFWFQSGGRDLDMIPCALDAELRPEQSLELLREISAFRDRHAASGIPVYLMLVPTTDTIWPERLPPALRTKCLQGGNPVQATLSAYEGDLDHVLYDVDWFRNYDSPNLYEGRNFHWFRPGSAAYQNHVYTRPPIASQIEAQPLGAAATTTEEIDMAADLGVGALRAEIPMRRYPSNPSYMSLPRRDDETKAELLPLMRPNGGGSVLFSQDGPGEQFGLLLGDSFTGQAWTYFSRNFNESARFNLTRVRNERGILDRIVEATEPDFILIVFADEKLAIAETSPSAFSAMFEPAQ